MEFTPPESEMMYTFLEEEPTPGEWQQSGVRFPLQHLRKMKGRILLLPLEFMSLYNDVVTHNALVAKEYGTINRHMLLLTRRTLPAIEDLNTTTIGNLASIALNCTIAGLQKEALDILNRLHDRYVEKYGSDLQKNVPI